MKCSECYWCVLNKATSDEMICCNQESDNYNKIFTQEETEISECEDAETEREVDYKNMNAWQFASKWYM